MAGTKDFSGAELEVMKVLWKKGPATAREVQAEFSEKKAWCYTTVMTFIARLYNKGYLKREKVGLAYVYTPLPPETKTMGKIMENFINRVFDGDLTPLMNYLSESDRLKPDEIAVLRKLVATLDRKEAENG